MLDDDDSVLVMDADTVGLAVLGLGLPLLAAALPWTNLPAASFIGCGLRPHWFPCHGRPARSGAHILYLVGAGARTGCLRR